VRELFVGDGEIGPQLLESLAHFDEFALEH
jgi:hypothetical protein